MNDIDTATIPDAELPSVSFTADDRAFVFAIARRIVRDEDDANDVAQEALLTAFRHRHGFQGKSRYRTWLYRVAVTSALSHLRQRRQRRYAATDSLDGGTAADQLVSEQPGPDGALAAAEAAAIVRTHLDRLDPRYASVLRLRLDQDLGEAEVARSLGLSVATVKIRGHRARRALRETLAVAL
ncbi:MAG: sigma-70 family RNA polymerase sigma factor [Kofleriaceae bacterium]